MDSRRDRWLAAALLLVVALLAVLLAPEEGRDVLDERASSFHAAPAGTRALHLLLEELEIPVERRLEEYGGENPQGPVALLAPSESPTPGELDALMRWVEAGGTLVYAARPGDLTLDSLGLGLVPLDRREAAEPLPHRWTEGVGEVHGFGWAFADSSRAITGGGGAPFLAVEGERPVVLAIRRGEGTVVAWSDVEPLRNRVLRSSGAALVFARVAREATGGERPLQIDEYHHGYRGGGSAIGGTMRFLLETRPGAVVLQLMVATAGLLLLLGRRFGSPVPPAPALRRSPLEHVEALAGAYRQAGARSTTRRLLLAGLARRLGRRAEREEELLDRLAASVAGGARARRIRAELEREERTDLVALSREVDHLIAEVKRK